MAVRLFVGNLSFDVSESELKDVFSAAGTVTHIFFPLDRETGRPRGFAFVEFGEKAEAEQAIQRFNGYELQGRALVVNEARSRDAGARPGGGQRPGPPPRPYQPRTPYLDPPIEEGEIKPSRLRPRDVGPAGADKRKRKKNKRPRGGSRGETRERGGGRYYGEFDYDDE